MDKQIAEYTKVSTPLVERGEAIVIDSPDALVEATAILSQINKNLDFIKVSKNTILDPLKIAAKAEKARWEPLESLFKPVVASLRTKLSEYQTMVLKAKAEADAKIAARVKEGKGNLKAETAVRKMEDNAVETKVETAVGGLSFREKKTLKITDEGLVPEKYWIIDEDAVLADLKEGVTVPGAEIEILQVPVNKR